LGKKLNSLLEAEGVNVVGKGPRERLLRAKKRTGVSSGGESNGSSGSGVLERLKSKNLKGFAKRTWRRFSWV
jgi:hypothetical protein